MQGKLTDAQVREIRHIYSFGVTPTSVLADKYGVSKTHIGAIWRGERRAKAGGTKRGV